MGIYDLLYSCKSADEEGCADVDCTTCEYNENNKVVDVDTQDCIDAQLEYVNEHKIPLFAPADGVCWCCHKNIYGTGGYGLTRAATRHITGCSRCMRTFCD